MKSDPPINPWVAFYPCENLPIGFRLVQLMRFLYKMYPSGALKIANRLQM